VPNRNIYRDSRSLTEPDIVMLSPSRYFNRPMESPISAINCQSGRADARLYDHGKPKPKLKSKPEPKTPALTPTSTNRPQRSPAPSPSLQRTATTTRLLNPSPARRVPNPPLVQRPTLARDQPSTPNPEPDAKPAPPTASPAPPLSTTAELWLRSTPSPATAQQTPPPISPAPITRPTASHSTQQ
jgi:hypothetical protein